MHRSRIAALAGLMVLLVLGHSGLAQNVGINTQTPSEPLEVGGIIYSSADGFKFPDGSVQSRAATQFSSSDASEIRHFVLMEIDGYQGPFTIQGHDEMVKLHDISWGVARSQSSFPGALGVREYEDFIVLKDVDKTSVDLIKDMVQGNTIATVMFHYFQEDTVAQQLACYFTIEMTAVRIKSIHQFMVYAGGDSFRHLEQLGLVCQQIEWYYDWDDFSRTFTDNVAIPGK